MRNVIFFPIFLLGSVRAVDYYGVSVGELSGSGTEGEVFLVNSTHLQILDFKSENSNLPPVPFVLISSTGQKSVPKIYKYEYSPNGEWLKKLVSLGEDHKTYTRLVVKMTGSAAQWKQFAVVDSNGSILSSVNLDKKPPQPFCCFEREADMGLFGEYGIISDPIEVLDSKTLKVPRFSYKASQTPDGYFFAGTGSEIETKSGKKLAVIGKDTVDNICPMLQDISDRDMIIRLAENQTIYDIEWLSVFCVKYSHDFGHLDLGLVDNEEQVPPYMPEMRSAEPTKSVQKSC
uniref:DM13 domain-containing protein n=1 Tax=Caenorhabditis japonica TaxID=281687 RepID=A0A8R1DMP4_CAEJA